MNRKLLSFLLVCFFLSRMVFADAVGVLVVHVVAAATQKAVSGVRVSVRSAVGELIPQSLQTDQNGEARFPSLSIGEYEVSVDGVSEPQVIVIRVNAESELFFEQPPKEKGEKVIKIASKRLLMNSNDTAGSSSYKDRNFIETRMANNNSLNSVADLNPGVDAESSGQIHFRGEHRSMTLEIDGILLPIPVEAQIGSLVDPRFLDEMEVRTGSYDATFSGQLGGVLNLVTRSGAEKPYFVFNPEVGDHGTLGAVAMLVGSSDEGHFNYFFGNSVDHTNLRLEAPNPTFQAYNNQGDDENSLLHLSWQQPNDKINLTFGIENLRVNIPNTPSEQAAGVNQWQRENNAFGILSLRHQFSDNFQMLFGFSYLGSHQGVGNNGIFNVWTPANPLTMPHAAAEQLPANPEDPGNPFLPTLGRANSQKLLSVTFTDKIAPGNTLRFGGTANFLRLDDSINIIDAGGAGTLPGGVAQYVAQDHRSGFDGGMFVGDSFFLTPKLATSIGLRLDRYSNGVNVDTSQVSPLFNFSYAFSSTQALRWSIDRTFTAPPLESDPTGNSRVIPQKTVMYELSYENQPTSDFVWKVGAYEKNIRDSIDIALLVPLSNMPVFAPDNFPSAQRVGVEISAMTQKRGGLNWFANVNLTSMHILQPQPPPAPQIIPFVDDFENQIVTFGTSYKWKNGCYISFNNKYGSGIPQGTIAAYNADGVYPFGIHGPQSRFITDFKIGYEPGGGDPNASGIGANLKILNLFNNRRAMELLSDFSGTRFVQERRSILELTARF